MYSVLYDQYALCIGTYSGTFLSLTPTTHGSDIRGHSPQDVLSCKLPEINSFYLVAGHIRQEGAHPSAPICLTLSVLENSHPWPIPLCVYKGFMLV